MNQTKTIVIVGIITFALIGLGAWAMSRPNQGQVTSSADAKAEATELFHSWGDVPINGGNVTQSFEIKNPGTAPLQLTNIVTSCLCTTAQVTIGDKKSPFFGMHSKSTWVGEVSQGKTAQLEVTFDPAFHGPTGTGPFTRQVIVETNDSGNPKIEFNLDGTVVK